MSDSLPSGSPSLHLLRAAHLSLIAGGALAAYTLYGVPFQWLAQMAAIGFAVLLWRRRALLAAPGTRLFKWSLGWSVLVTLVAVLMQRESPVMPLLATTSYPVFVILRFLAPIAFLAAAGVFFSLLAWGHREALIRLTVNVATVVSLFAAYIYVAQVYDLPEPTRNRVGTSGDEQATRFSYEFHRAMGTFREPSQLAEFLVLPLFLSLVTRQRWRAVHTVIIGSTLLLTGSLTGIVGSALGFSLAALVTNPFRLKVAAVWTQVAFAAVLSLIGFNLVVSSYSMSRPELGDVLATRILPLLHEGIAATNRAYVYEFAADTPVPVLGLGGGNANLVLCDYLGVEIVTSFLSLYLNYLYAYGVPGLVLLVAFLVLPVIGVLGHAELRTSARTTTMLCAYVAWIIMFAVHSEELTVMFALSYAFLAYEVAAVGAARWQEDEARRPPVATLRAARQPAR